MEYTFTRDQLFRLLDGAIKMFVECRDVHGHPEQDGADIAAISEVLEGLDAERELADAGVSKPTMQVYRPQRDQDMKLIRYEVIKTTHGFFAAVKRTEWPDLDQKINPPVSVCLNRYPSREAAAEACRYDASWQHIVDADTGRKSEIVCEV